MADQTPLKAVFDQYGNVIALGQYTSADFVGVSNGGTGNSTYPTIPTFNVSAILITHVQSKAK